MVAMIARGGKMKECVCVCVCVCIYIYIYIYKTVVISEVGE